MAAVADPQQQLAWEARQRPRAGVLAILAGVLTLGGFIWSAVAFREIPRSGFLGSLAASAEPGAAGTRASLRLKEFQFYDDRALTFIGSSLVRGLAYIAFAWALTFLAAATRARRPELPRLVVYIGLVGAVLSAVATIISGVGTVLAVQDFLDGPRTVDAVGDFAKNSLLQTAQLLSLLAPLGLAAGVLLVSLNAMRVGLLTRFLGVLGMICGGLVVFSQFVFAFVATFWLVAIGLVFLGVPESTIPPSWRTGEPEPWPSQREVAESRRATRQKAPEATPEPVAATPGRAHPSSKKRKRKRRS